MALRQLEDGIRQLQLRVGALLGLAAPVGKIDAFAGSTAPAGWLLCDGSAVSRTTYAALFAVLGTTYGAGDGSSTFNVPDAKGRVLAGRDAAQTEFDALGETGGAKTHTLTEAQLPAHKHTPYSSQDSTPIDRFDFSTSLSGRTAGSTTVSIGGLDQVNVGNRFTGTTASNPSNDVGLARVILAASTGGGAAHPILQPYLTVNFIIKAN